MALDLALAQNGPDRIQQFVRREIDVVIGLEIAGAISDFLEGYAAFLQQLDAMILQIKNIFCHTAIKYSKTALCMRKNSRALF